MKQKFVKHAGTKPRKPGSRDAKPNVDGIELMTEEEANELVFGDFADEITMYGLGDIGNK